jgi:hypothetical protein
VASSTDEKVKIATSLYTPFLLRMYDWFLLGYNCRFVWRCPSRHMLELYNRYVSANHLDIGVGTGYFMNRCRFPSANPRLALMDYSPNSLEAAAGRLARYHPETYRHNVLEPFRLDAPAFDSVGMMNLLHCLPGDIKAKSVVFEHAREVMNPDAVLFGCTILHKGVKQTLMSINTLRFSNRRGVMNNLDDSLDDLKDSLRRHFRESAVDVIGCEALFWARK